MKKNILIISLVIIILSEVLLSPAFSVALYFFSGGRFTFINTLFFNNEINREIITKFAFVEMIAAIVAGSIVYGYRKNSRLLPIIFTVILFIIALLDVFGLAIANVASSMQIG